jgi:hypothetical protein
MTARAGTALRTDDVIGLFLPALALELSSGRPLVRVRGV